MWGKCSSRAWGRTCAEKLWADDMEVAVPRIPVPTKSEALRFARSGRMQFLTNGTSDIRAIVYDNAGVVAGRLQRIRSMNRNEISVIGASRTSTYAIQSGGAWFDFMVLNRRSLDSGFPIRLSAQRVTKNHIQPSLEKIVGTSSNVKDVYPRKMLKMRLENDWSGRKDLNLRPPGREVYPGRGQFSSKTSGEHLPGSFDDRFFISPVA